MGRLDVGVIDVSQGHQEDKQWGVNADVGGVEGRWRC